MTAKKLPIVTGIVLSVLLVPSVTSTAYAVYLGNPGADGDIGVGTLEEALHLAREKARAVDVNVDSLLNLVGYKKIKLVNNFFIILWHKKTATEKPLRFF